MSDIPSYLSGFEEICTTLCPGTEEKGATWGYLAAGEGHHRSEDDVWILRSAGARGCNLLLNSGPLPDGSLDPEDIPVLEAIGRCIRREGFPS